MKNKYKLYDLTVTLSFESQTLYISLTVHVTWNP